MATTSLTTVRTGTDHHHSRTGLRLVAYLGLVIGTIVTATGVTVFVAGMTNGLGQFVLLAGAWLALVSAAPAVAERGMARIGGRTPSRRATRSNRAVQAVVTAIFAR